MSRSRKKKKTAIPLFAAIAIIALTVVMIALFMIAVLSVGNPTGTGAPTDDRTIPATTPMAGAVTTSAVTTPADTTPQVPNTPGVTTTAPKPVTTTPSVTTTAKPVTTTAPPPQTTPPTSERDYKIDMSKYMDAVDPQGDLWDDAYLRLVNVSSHLGNGEENSIDALKSRKKFSASSDYKYVWKPDIEMNVTAQKALSAMFNEAAACGIKNLDVTSAYRSYSYQNTLFNNNCNKTYHWICADDSCNVDWIGKSSNCPLCGKKTSKTMEITREEQEANVATYSCAPGTSDHQTGLAVDIVQTSLPSRFDALIQEFGETEAGKWLAANCYRFGFVLRFPPDKEDITGIIYEPWHFRYVGRTHATAMFEMNLCLEEYVEYLESTGYFE